MKVVLLCGGQGTRMREETEFRPKPMVEIGGRPILWHIMKLYAAADVREFVLCLGYRGAMIKDYFLHYHAQNSDISLDLASGEVQLHRRHLEDWRVTLVDTGLDAMTGARVKRIAPYIGDDDIFLCTYGDGLADIDIRRARRVPSSPRQVSRPSPASRLPPASGDSSRTARPPRRSQRSRARAPSTSTAASSCSIGACSTGSATTRGACSSVSRWKAWPGIDS